MESYHSSTYYFMQMILGITEDLDCYLGQH